MGTGRDQGMPPLEVQPAVTRDESLGDQGGRDQLLVDFSLEGWSKYRLFGI